MKTVNDYGLSELKRIAGEMRAKSFALQSLFSGAVVREQIITEDWQEIEFSKGHMARYVSIPDEHNVSMLVMDIAPGANMGMHSNPGSVYVFIVKGCVSVDVAYNIVEDGVFVEEKRMMHELHPGQTLMIPGGVHHGGFCASDRGALAVCLFDRPVPLSDIFPSKLKDYEVVRGKRSNGANGGRVSREVDSKGDQPGSGDGVLEDCICVKPTPV